MRDVRRVSPQRVPGVLTAHEEFPAEVARAIRGFTLARD